MLVNLDKFELLNYLNGCAIGSHLRQGVWKRCVDEFYNKLNDKERKFIYEYSIRDLWEIMARDKYPNYKKEYPKAGFEDFRKFLACFNPDNRYHLKIEGEVDGKIQRQEVDAYLYENKYWTGFNRYVPKEYIKSKQNKGE